MIDAAERTRLLRGYELGTLAPGERDRVERELAASEEWRTALEAEREALRRLDALPDEAPPPGLARRTVEAVEAADGAARNRSGRTPQWAYALVSLAVIGVVAATLLPGLTRAREAASRASSQNNLKQIGIVFKMYAGENRGLYPPRAPYKDVWMFDLRAVYPEYLTDLAALVNPSLPDGDKVLEEMEEAAAKRPIDWEKLTRLAARSYTYPGWIVMNEGDVQALRTGVQRVAKAELDSDLTVGEKTLRRPREGIERYLVTDINNPAAGAQTQSVVPIVFETVPPKKPFRVPPGANVLYMDGHVEFVRQGTKFPVTTPTQDALRQGE